MEQKVPIISICIPADKNTAYLKRLLDAVAAQTFVDYEVIVTDDSPDETVQQFVSSYAAIKNIRYFKNTPAAGTPQNWNEAISHAQGKWIKLMHDDDWFAHPDALQHFVEATQQRPHCRFFFSAFQNVVQETGAVQPVRCTQADLLFLKWSPLHLFKRVYVGNPSCTFIRRNVGLTYDRDFKFVVDFEYYIRCLRTLRHWHYIDEVLINVGFNNEQVTGYTFLRPAVQIPENYNLLHKMGTGILHNIFVYDYYWRMHRNLCIRSVEEAQTYFGAPPPPAMQHMIHLQQKVPLSVLQKGILSKALMLGGYLTHLLRRS